jgi:hypothetical protein
VASARLPRTARPYQDASTQGAGTCRIDGDSSIDEIGDMLVDFARGSSQAPTIQGLEFFNRLIILN